MTTSMGGSNEPTLSQMSQMSEAAGAAKQPHRLRIWSVFEQRSLLRTTTLFANNFVAGKSPNSPWRFGWIFRPSLSKPEGNATERSQVTMKCCKKNVLLSRILTESGIVFAKVSKV